MKTLALILSAVLPIAAIPGLAAAQKLEVGKWTGHVIAPDGDRAEATYDVTMKGDTIDITVTAAEHGSFTFSDVKLVENTLTFWFQPGPRVDCELNRRDDGAFEGECTDSNGGKAQMLMVPPKKE